MSTPAPPRTLHWALSPGRVTGALLVLSGAFLLVSVAVQALLLLAPDNGLAQGLARATSVDREGNLPSLFAASLLLAAAGLLGLLARLAHGTPDARAWRVLCGVFLYLTTDEYLHLHELIMDPLQALVDPGGQWHHTWVIPYAALTAALGLWLRPFLRRLPGASRRAFLSAGAVYLSGTVGMEVVGAITERLLGGGPVLNVALTTVEEALELLGMVLFVGALLRHLGREAPDVRLSAGVAPLPVPAARPAPAAYAEDPT